MTKVREEKKLLQEMLEEMPVSYKKHYKKTEMQRQGGGMVNIVRRQQGEPKGSTF